MAEPVLLIKPRMQFVGLETSFIHGLSPETNNFKVIPALWDAFIRRSGEVPRRVGQELYGVITARPESERGHPDELQYMAGVLVSDIGEIPAGMIAHTVPESLVAHVTHRGPIRNIAVTVRALYREWLPNSAYRHRGLADIELYDQRFCADSNDSEMEYWITIEPKDPA